MKTEHTCLKRRILISTGEVSGDLQGALLIEALQRQARNLNLELEILALGGAQMAQAGATLLADTSAIGSIGLFETLPHVFSTLQIQRRVQQYLRQVSPDLVVLIDYFGPNLGIGRLIRRELPQVSTVYYIAPQEWVWSISQRNTTRILDITDRLLAIFPAEATYYQAHGANVTWVGHPLIDRMQTAPSRIEARKTLGLADDDFSVALIPVSRPQELKYVLPVIFAAAQQIQAQLPQVRFWIPLALERYRAPIEQAIEQFGLQATIVWGSHTVIAAADLVIAKSGTVNLETALLEVPQVVMYRVNPLTAWIAEHLLRFAAPFVSPPNLVMMQPIVPEFLQRQATPSAIAQAALEILQSPEMQQQMRVHYRQMRQKLGEPGVCDRAAEVILQLLGLPGSVEVLPVAQPDEVLPP
jgi:lipid-A-disaccharide synthase